MKLQLVVVLFYFKINSLINRPVFQNDVVVGSLAGCRGNLSWSTNIIRIPDSLVIPELHPLISILN